MSSRYVALAFAVVVACGAARAQHLAADGSWLAYADPVEAGFDRAALDEARALWEASDSASLMVVHDGTVVVAWGDVERRYMCHSTRKSVLSALIGVAVDRGVMDTEMTLADLDIDEPDRPLTDVEKTARISDLLKARSGVYMTAAYEPPQNPKPERGAYAPGRHWVYNNWDFNTLATIYMEQTGRDVFEAMTEDLFDPIGTEDWRLRDGYLHVQPHMSIHPAYPLRMSARDMARFGQLFLQEGEWAGERVLSANWVRRSAASYSESWMGGYGYMWWLLSAGVLGPYDTYAALGVGQQLIAVMPPVDMVAVNRTDTYAGDRPSIESIEAVVAAVVAARTSDGIPNPRRVPLVTPTFPKAGDGAHAVDTEQLAKWAGSALVPAPVLGLDDRNECTLAVDGGSLLMHTPRAGTFHWWPQPDGTFLEEDSLTRWVPIGPSGALAPVGSELDGFARWHELVDAGYTAWVEGDEDRAASFLGIAHRHCGGRAPTAGSGVLVAVIEGGDPGAVDLGEVGPEDVVEWLGRVAEGLDESDQWDAAHGVRQAIGVLTAEPVRQ